MSHPPLISRIRIGAIAPWILGLATLLVVLEGASVTWTLHRTGVGGVIDRDLESFSSLRADVLPPPLYLLEAFGHCQEIGRVGPKESVVHDLEGHLLQYRMAKEQDRLIPLAESKPRLDHVLETGDSLWEAITRDYLPLVKSNRLRPAQILLDSTLALLFARHELAVQELVSTLESEGSARRASAYSEVSKSERNQTITIALTALLLLLSTVLLSRNLAHLRKMAKLEASESLQRSILASARYLMLTTLPSGKISTLNREAESVLGWSLDELKSNDADPSFFDMNRDDTPAPNRDAIPSRFLELIRALVGTPSVEHEYVWRRRDGSNLEVHVSITPMRSSNSVEPDGYLVIARDLTNDREQNSEIQRLKLALESSPVSVLITDTDGTIVYANPFLARTVDLNREDILGKNPRIWKSGIHPEQFYRKLWKTLLEGMVWSGEMCNRKSGGELFWENAVIAPIRGMDGRTTHYVSVKKDITEERRNRIELLHAKEKAEAAALAKSQFLSTMSHEIRTPLNGVIGLTNLLLMGGPRADQVSNLETLRFSAEHLLLLVNDILDFSKIEAGRLELEKAAISPGTIANNVAEILRPKALEKGIAISVEVDPGTPESMQGDSVRLGQILTNLAGNAVKFTEKGRVRIDLKPSEDGSALDFEVTDSGIGIPENQLSGIFDSFTQAEANTTRRFGGTGLGLAITKRLLEAMGSRIEVESTIGVGSTFRFRLPVKRIGKEPDATIQIAKPPANSGTGPLVGMRVLLVEDNPVNVLVAGQFLKVWGTQWAHAENGKIACDMAASAKWDAILMDLQMPVMDGYEASRRIRESGDGTPIFALTASALLDHRDKAIACGITDIVTKPFRPDELLGMLNSVYRRIENPATP